MNIQLRPVELAEVRDELRQHLAKLPSAIDSYLEEHILSSTFYRIVVAERASGFAAIHQQSLITQFALSDDAKGLGQRAFREVRRLEQVSSALVFTGDEFMLAHALDDFRHLTKQAYFFAVRPEPEGGRTVDELRLRPATSADVARIRDESGDFFAPIGQNVHSGKVYVALSRDAVAGFGLIVRSALLADVASIGMFTIDRFRGTGVGTDTIRLLMAECHQRGWRPVAGCWYYNHASKRTLERAGMFTPSRLLRIEF